MTRIIRSRKSLFAFCLSLGVAATASAQVYPLSENSWDNPEFRERFMGSYGVDTEISPNISPAEKTLFEEIVPLVSNDPKAAIARLKSAITADSSAAFDFILGNLYYQEDDMAGSVAAYRAAIKKFPTYYRAYLNAGRAEVNRGHYAEGLPLLQKALEIQPGDGSLYGLIGYCYLNLENYASALDAYRMAIMLAPNSLDWKRGKLQSLIALDLTKEAIGMLYELIAADPANADWWKFQANQFINQGEPMKAAANLSVVRDLGKADSATLVLLGDILLNEGVYGPALTSYEGAIATGKVRPERIFRVVRNLLAIGEPTSAESLLGSFTEGSPVAIEGDLKLELLNLQAEVAMATGDQDAASAYLEEIVSKDPMNGPALLSLSKFEVEKGDLAKAEFYAENATKVEAVALNAYLALARIKVSQKEYREAANALRQAQAIKPQEFVANYLLKVEQAAMRL